MSETPAQTIERILSAVRFRFATEEELQDGIAEALKEYHPQREVRLNAGDRIDFVLWDVGIEVKIRGGVSALTRQLVRYSDVEQLRAILVVTSQSQYALQLPRVLNGKPVIVVCVRRGIG